MKKFDIKVLNKKLLFAIGIPIIVVYLILVLFYVLDDVEGENNTLFTLLIAIVPLFLLFAFLSRVCRTNYIVELTDTNIVLRKKDLVEKSIPYKDIILIRQFGANQVYNLIVFSKSLSMAAKDSLKPSIELLQVLKNNDVMETILNTLLESGTYVKTQRQQNNQLWIEYINKEMIDSEAEVIADIKSSKSDKKKNKKALVFVFAALFLIIVVLIAFAAISKSNEKYYTFGYDYVSYGGEKLDINPKEVKQLSYTVLKDSSHIYYNGEILAWADRATFECLEAPFYYDKNGVYYETNNMFSADEIKPLEGDYDKATFKYVGRLYYKDKDKLYKLKLGVLSVGDNPLEEISAKDIDLASFQLIDKSSFYWFKDKNKIYFASDKKLRPADDIDPSTFEVLTFEVAKDKNHVYYITNNLKSEGKRATDYADYAILKGADAPSFEMIGNNKFQDKNTEWSIDR